jgi:tRNA pseudouridine55 synthase
MNKKFAMNGVININKPVNMTSHDVVDVIRRKAKMKRVGHTGTLDPMATGVLPLCLGQATKIVQFLIAQDKEYSVEMQLGLITDTQDTTGQTTEENDVPDFSHEKIEETLNKFTGEIMQTPPMVSAKHHKGKRLYELARQGVEVKREPCKIHIHELTLKAVELPFIRFDVNCSKGTYIRTLCHDIGQALECGASMSGLVRVRCGAFHINDSTNLNDLESSEEIEQKLVNINDALSGLPTVVIGSEGRASINFGRSLNGGSITRRKGDFVSGSLVRLTYRDGSLLAVGEALIGSDQLDSFAGNLNVIKPVKVFHHV